MVQGGKPLSEAHRPALTPAMTLAQLQDYCSRIPFNTALGIAVTAIEADGACLVLPWQDMLGGSRSRDHMHGGVIATLIDVTCGLTLVAFTGSGAPTVDMRVDFHRGVTPGELRSRGKLLRLGRTLAVLDSEVHDSANKLVASGRAVFSVGHQDPTVV